MKKIIVLGILLVLWSCGQKEPILCAWEKDGITAVYDSANEKWYSGNYEDYYEDGSIALKAKYKDGRLDGEELSYSKSGALLSKAYYTDGKLRGERITYFESGEIWFRENYKDGKLEGEAIEYRLPNILASKGRYKNDMRDGKYIEYFSTGKIKKETTYEENIKEGEEVLYQKDKSGYIKNYYINGKIVERHIYDENEGIDVRERYEEGEFGEKVVGYDKDNNKRYEAEVRNGKLEGVYLGYCIDGHRTIEANYRENLQHGEENTYSCEGELKSTAVYKKGKLREKIEYYPNGRPMYEAYYIDGKIDGVVEGYDKYGELDYRFCFENGRAEGSFIFYLIDGMIEASLEFRDNKLVRGEIPEDKRYIVEFFMNQTIDYESEIL